MKIEPCPHCGKEAKLIKNHRRYGTTYEVKCTECGIQTGSYLDKDIVVAKWNRRQPAYLNSDFEAAVREMVSEEREERDG